MIFENSLCVIVHKTFVDHFLFQNIVRHYFGEKVNGSAKSSHDRNRHQNIFQIVVHIISFYSFCLFGAYDTGLNEDVAVEWKIISEPYVDCQGCQLPVTGDWQLATDFFPATF